MGLGASPPSISATPGCSPCLAVFSFLLGAFGGYIATTILNGNEKGQRKEAKVGPATGDIVDGKGARVGQAQHEHRAGHSELDDEGNPIIIRSAREDLRQKEDGDGEQDRGQKDDSSCNTYGDGGGGTVIVEGEDSDGGADTCSTNAGPRSLPVATIANDSVVANDGPVKLVVQRFRSASLLLRPGETEVVRAGRGGCGLLLYVSFGKSAGDDPSIIYAAARTVLNLPVLTRGGVWGDGSGTASVLALAEEANISISKERDGKDGDFGGSSGDTDDTGNDGVPVVIVPQANLVSKVKNQGKSIQYHGQIAKSLGKKLYERFVHSVHLIALERQHIVMGLLVPDSIRAAILDAGGTPSDPSSSKKGGNNAFGAVAGLDASVPPEEMFQDGSLYESWDDAGFPLTKVGGKPTTKSAMKKMRKQYEAQRKRHEKYLATTTASSLAASSDQGRDPDSSIVANTTKMSVHLEAKGEGRIEGETSLKADPTFIRVVAGTFGNLQALDFASDMGPFCHLLNMG